MARIYRSCGTCIYRVKDRCRRYPPIVSADLKRWPEIEPDRDWCGEYEAKWIEVQNALRDARENQP